MTCPKCRAENVDTALFCLNCGQRFKKKNNIKKIILIIIAVLLLVTCIFGIVGIFFKNKKQDLSGYGATQEENIISYVNSEVGIPKFVDGNFSKVIVKDDNDIYKVLDDVKDLLKITDSKQEFSVEEKHSYEDNTYYRLNQVYEGLKVYNNDIIVTVDKSGLAKTFAGNYIPNINIDINNQKSKEDLESIVLKDLGSNAKIYESEKCIYADSQNTNLVYVIKGYSDNDAREYIVDAVSGEIINKSSYFEEAIYNYTGKGIKDIVHSIQIEDYYDLGDLKTKYRFIDPKRDIRIYNFTRVGPVMGTFASAVNIIDDYIIRVDLIDNDIKYYDMELAKAAVTTMKYYEDIYDYYKNVLGRNSYDNKGSSIKINLGITAETFSSKELGNAFWNSLTNQMYIGKYEGYYLSLSKDVLGHEFTHGVISHTSKFANSPKKADKNKAFETGALNEGIADVLGSLIEDKDWYIAKEFGTPRNLENPFANNLPKKVGGDYYFPDYYMKGYELKDYLKAVGVSSLSEIDQGGVHTNATVIGHAAYLMDRYGAFSSHKEMAKVWYNSLFMLSSYADFEDFGLALIKSAENLGLSKTSITKIKNALFETNILEDNRVKVTGSIISGEIPLKDVNIEIYRYDEEQVLEKVITDSEGKFNVELSKGVYKFKITKEGFEDYQKDVIVLGDTVVDLKMINIVTKELEETNKSGCKKKGYHAITAYFSTLTDDEGISETMCIKDGDKLDYKMLEKTINNSFGDMINVTTDGKIFKMQTSYFTFSYAWYYKDTDKVYDFNNPVHENAVIEMKWIDFPNLFGS